jgi:hypothetical protein
VAPSGNGIFFGTGSSEQGTPGVGIYAYTPGGVPPTAPTASPPASPPPSSSDVGAGRSAASAPTRSRGLPPTGALPWPPVVGGAVLAVVLMLRRLRQFLVVERLHGDIEG